MLGYFFSLLAYSLILVISMTEFLSFPLQLEQPARPPKKLKPWSAEETRLLNLLVNDCGHNWVFIAAQMKQTFGTIREYTSAACRNHYFRKEEDCFGRKRARIYGEEPGEIVRKRNNCKLCGQPKRGHLCQAISRTSAESAHMLLSIQE